MRIISSGLEEKKLAECLYLVGRKEYSCQVNPGEEEVVLNSTNSSVDNRVREVLDNHGTVGVIVINHEFGRGLHMVHHPLAQFPKVGLNLVNCDSKQIVLDNSLLRRIKSSNA